MEPTMSLANATEGVEPAEHPGDSFLYPQVRIFDNAAHRVGDLARGQTAPEFTPSRFGVAAVLQPQLQGPEFEHAQGAFDPQDQWVVEA